MTFQIRAIPAETSALGKEIARLLEDTAQGILAGVPPERYIAHVARYQALLELMDFMTERNKALDEGETTTE